MSNSDKSSSSDEDEGESNEILNPVQKCCYFLTETGHSLNFVLLPDDMTESEVTEATKLIQSRMGTVSTSKKRVSSHTAVLVADEATSWDYFGDVFKFSYINDCIEAGKLLNIALYLKNRPSKLYVENFDYMSVIYYRKYSWETIPPIYKLSKPTKRLPEPPRETSKPPREASDSDSSIESIRAVKSVRSVTLPRYSKQTKQQYSYDEKEAMIRYVVERKMYHRVKGKQIYKEMEAANICPIRTWQSMKDHFLRCLAKEITRFSFLTSQQKKQLQNALYPYK